MSQDLLPVMVEARARFLELVADVRPELHRYCARMTGNVFDGEDIVQDTLAKAYFALSEMEEPPPLRAWLFRIGHNAAMDYLRRYEHKHVDLVAETPEAEGAGVEGADPLLVEAALSAFVVLPPVQRSAVVLKDVLGHSLEEAAASMGTSVLTVKGALVRARANLAASKASSAVPSISAEERRNLQRYADLFDARDWDGLRALLGEEAQLDVVARWQRRGNKAARYYTIYAELTRKEDMRAHVGLADGVPVIVIQRPAATPYFIRLTWDGNRVQHIRDFVYVPYLYDNARLTPLTYGS